METESRENGWINVSDRLPEMLDKENHSEIVLVWTGFDYSLAFYLLYEEDEHQDRNGDWFCLLSMEPGIQVQYWKHLPPPPVTIVGDGEC